MTDLISRQAAIDALDEIEAEVADGYGYQYAKWREYFAKMRPAQPKTGKWEMGIDERFVKCSECGLMTTRNELRGLAVFGKNEPNFCPNCGAEMRGERDEP